MSKGVHKEHEHKHDHLSCVSQSYVKCINSNNSAMPLPLMTAPMAPIYDIRRWNPPSLMTTKSNEECTISEAFK